MIRVVLADDHPIVRQGLRTLLENLLGWEILGAGGGSGISRASIRRIGS